MDRVKNGIDIIRDNKNKIEGLRIGLITNYTGVDESLNSTIDILNKVGRLVCLFSPEHGVRGNFQAGAHVPDYIDEKTGIKVYSLYGDIKKPTGRMIKDIDTIIFDMQDVGVRFYTYLYTMAYAMQSAKEFDKKFIVLDRPNPIGGMKVEGNILDSKFSSFVGMYPIPVRYGLTIGELAMLLNQEFGIGCDLEVVKIAGWQRRMYFDDTQLNFIAPSPNIPNVDTAILYAGTCFFEGTNVSEGRGTTQPFQIIGAPWIDCYHLAEELNALNLEGAIFRPHYFTPTFSKYKGELCRGVQIHITDREAIEPFKIGIYLISKIYENYDEFEFLPPYKEGGRCFFDLLAGTNKLRKSVIDGTIEDYIEECKEDLKKFKNIRREYMIY
ncbi:exo-beta-N-acetylmuramidase NamZ family protein [Xylanivirga thermophila]|jgi:uncharacterized protein YbbC (DUF1343 family)|uniref:exo-beta-N-acetylmuramidase NamZ family protein n=1 Tax=Xylanivirga thermophila TaxID=2496273 RepID=UPI00101B6B68|nr:DUF1343 domain-containing protein [Xylanivirga thermophila]